MKDTTIIGSSDGPTSVILLKNEHKPNMKQRFQRRMFELRKKWHALWIKPNPHTMEEVADYIRNKYDFVELPKDDERCQRYYKELRSSFIMMYAPELLEDGEKMPELAGEDEEDVKDFLDQMRLRQEKTFEIPEELFSLEHYYFEKQEDDVLMHIQLEARYGYIGGGASGKFISKYHRIYKDVYKYYGVSEEDIANNSRRYQDLLRTLAMRH